MVTNCGCTFQRSAWHSWQPAPAGEQAENGSADENGPNDEEGTSFHNSTGPGIVLVFSISSVVFHAPVKHDAAGKLRLFCGLTALQMGALLCLSPRMRAPTAMRGTWSR